MAKVEWTEAIKPLIKKYKGKQHPLDYKDNYQLIVMVILSARSTDAYINKIAPALFKAFPTMKAMAKATPDMLMQFIGKVPGAKNKVQWILKMAKEVSIMKELPLSMEELTKLPGIGRKSANVIKREAGTKAEGIMVDLHVVRVAPRLGIAKGTDPKKIEEQLMEVLPQKQWGEAGMAISFLGRETCRPKNPKHAECVMNGVCEYYKGLKK